MLHSMMPQDLFSDLVRARVLLPSGGQSSSTATNAALYLFGFTGIFLIYTMQNLNLMLTQTQLNSELNLLRGHVR